MQKEWCEILLYCSNCGLKLPQNAQFCVECGHKAIIGVNNNKPKKSSFGKWVLGVIIAVVFCVVILAGIGALAEDEKMPSEHEDVEQRASETFIPELKVEAEENGKESADESVVGETKVNPIVVDVDTLVEEINTDIEGAKEKYNGKWVEITGEIVNHYTVAGMTGYYLYGDRGNTGLRIICWRDGEPYSGAMLGETFTFIGIMREVTTFNATEIGECEIIIE